MASDGDPSVEEYKRKGNEAFKVGNLDEAIKNYNKAISLDATIAPLYSNRAACWSSKGSHENALRDAEKCIELDPKFVKGYSRKGKALFDLQRYDEADGAYQAGLSVEPENETCRQGVAAIKYTRLKAKNAASGSFRGLTNLGSVGAYLRRLLAKWKLSGRLKMYLVVMVGYFMYNKVNRGGGSVAKTALDAADPMSDVQPGTYTLEPMILSRGFTQLGHGWVSHLTAGGGDTQLILLHRTASSAYTEFGAALQMLLEVQEREAQFAPFQVIAPDRPCHGFSPCAGPDARPGWLRGLVRSRPSSSNCIVVASGRDSMLEALSFTRGHGKGARLLLLSPSVVRPTIPFDAYVSPSDFQTWLGQIPAATAEEIVDAATWAAGSRLHSSSDVLSDGEPLPAGVAVSIIYTEADKEDTKLKTWLEELGADVSVRRLQTASAQLLATELKRALRDFVDDTSDAE